MPTFAAFASRIGDLAHRALIDELEAYPKPATRKMASTDLYVGTVRCFERAGFKVAAQPSEARAIVRRAVRKPRARRA